MYKRLRYANVIHTFIGDAKSEIVDVLLINSASRFESCNAIKLISFEVFNYQKNLERIARLEV